MAFGTTDLRDISAVLNFGATDMDATTVAKMGETAVYEETQRVLDIHNSILSELREELCQVTTDYQAVYGGAAGTIRMIRGNEYSNPLTQKAAGPTVTMGFPLEKSEVALQWTRRAFEKMSLTQFAINVASYLDADAKDFRKSIMNAIFTPTNNPNWIDYLTDYKTFNIYAFLNGDGNPIPVGRDGSTFPSNHTHYTYATSLTETVVRNVLTNVTEHSSNNSAVEIYIPSSYETTMRGFVSTGSFYPYRQEGIVLGADAVYADKQFLDMANPLNRSIGEFDGSVVKVRSWVPAGYIVVVDAGAPGDKPLAYRVEPNSDNSDLGLRFEDETYPLRAQVLDRVYGIAPWKREKVAVCYINGSASAYVAPASYPG